jgi:DNA polymerase-3 subunit gamma/tau
MLQPHVEAVGQPQITLQSFADVVRLIDKHRDIVLKLDLEKFARPISFRPGAIEFEPAPGAPNNLAQRLAIRLKEWTGQPWLVAAQGGGGAETILEIRKREEAVVRAALEADPFVRSVMEAFPGAEILSVRQSPAPEAPAEGEPPVEDEDD